MWCKALTAHEGYCPKRLLHEDLGDRRQIMMSVMRHDDTREQNGHDTYNQTEKDNSKLKTLTHMGIFALKYVSVML